MVSKQALVFGASGISGWAIVRECVLSGEFNRTVAITKRPLEALAFLLTEDKTKTIEVLSGVDLTKDVDSVIQRVKAIEDIDKITHVYYTGPISALYSPDIHYRLTPPPSLRRSRLRLPSPQSYQRRSPLHYHTSYHIPLSQACIFHTTNRRESLWTRILWPARLALQSTAQRIRAANP